MTFLIGFQRIKSAREGAIFAAARSLLAKK